MVSLLECFGEIFFFFVLFLGIFNGVFGFVVIIGNFMVLIMFFRNCCFRKFCYYLMVFLVVVDFLVGFVVNLFYIVLMNFVLW